MNPTSSSNTAPHVETNRIFKEIHELKTQESKGNFVIYDKASNSNRKAGFFERLFKSEAELKNGNDQALAFLTNRLSDHLLKNLENKIFTDGHPVNVDWQERDEAVKTAIHEIAEKIIDRTLSAKKPVAGKNSSANFIQQGLNSIKNHWISKKLSNLFSDPSNQAKITGDLKRVFLKNIKEPKNHKAISDFDQALKDNASKFPDISIPILNITDGFKETLHDMEEALQYGELYAPTKENIETLKSDSRLGNMSDSDKKSVAFYVAFLQISESNLGIDFLIEKAIEMKNIETLIGKNLAGKLSLREKFDLVIKVNRATDDKFNVEFNDAGKITSFTNNRKSSFYERSLKAAALIAARPDLYNELKRDFKNLNAQKEGFAVDFEQVIATMLDPECDSLSNLGRLQAAINYLSGQVLGGDENPLKDVVANLVQKDSGLYGQKVQPS